jgi:flagellin-specific chaperone FliS
LGKYIQYRLDQLDAGINQELMKECLAKSGESLDEVDAATVILRELWERLRETHKLRVVK